MITKKDMKSFGPVIVHLFEAMYPNGITLEQMRLDAPQHGWIRLVLEQMEDSYE